MENNKQRVYLDTTIFSYLVDDRDDIKRDIKRTLEWWTDEKQEYEVFTSQFVVIELSKKNFPRQEEALKLTKLVTELPLTDDIQNITETYMKEFIMPLDAGGDAAHLAVSSVYQLDYLLTWNCKHLANIKKKRHIEVINKRLNLPVPEILTPHNLRLEES